MRPFYLDRQIDVSGVSGTGRVAEGCVFDDGTCVIHWFGEHPSTNIYPSLDDMNYIHGHQGATQIRFL